MSLRELAKQLAEYADSIRLVFASCQPAAADSARAVRLASRRMSRSRLASCCLARWTLDDGEMATAAVGANEVQVG